MSYDSAAWDRMLGSMWSFFRTVPEGSHGGRCVELPGVMACVTPAVPERSLPNSVAYRDENALLGALDELAAIYDEAGVLAWTVWVPSFHERAKRARWWVATVPEARGRAWRPG